MPAQKRLRLDDDRMEVKHRMGVKISTWEKRRIMFERQGGKCHYCGIQMRNDWHSFTKMDSDGSTHTYRQLPSSMCTIEHLESRLNPLRGKFGGGRSVRTVAACFQCNRVRAKADCKRWGRWG